MFEQSTISIFVAKLLRKKPTELPEMEPTESEGRLMVVVKATANVEQS